MTLVDPTFIEPRDGDVVVVRASRIPNADLPPTSARRYAVIEWGKFELVSDRIGEPAEGRGDPRGTPLYRGA